MASIRKHGDGWQARVRRNGYPIEVRTFASKIDADQWARTIEADMGRGQFVSREKAEKTTFGDVIRKYMAAVTPFKKGCVEETFRLTATLRNRLSQLSMANLTPEAFATYRDERLKIANPAP